MFNFKVMILLVLLEMVYLEHTYYVKPKVFSQCPSIAEKCLTLGEYAENQNKYFMSSSKFIFLAGNHSTATIIEIKNVSNITFKGFDNYYELYKIDAAISFENTSDITIKMLIVMCSGTKETESTLSLTNSARIYLQNLLLQGSSSQFKKHQLRGIAINHSEVLIENCTFTENTALFGGVLSILDKSNVTLSGLYFIKNNVKAVGGAIFANQSTLRFIEKNTFSSNSADFEGGGIYCVQCTITSLAVIDFIDNYASKTGGAFILLDAKASFYNINVIGNSVTAIQMYRSTIEFSGITTMKYNSGILGGALSAEISSILFKGYTIFEQNYAVTEGGVIAGIINTKISFSGVTIFMNNSATVEGGGAILVTVHTELWMSGYVLFTKNNCTSCYGGAISITQSCRMIMSGKITFESNWAEMGGAVYFRDSTMVLKQGTTVVTKKNHAKYYGGGFFHEDNINYYQCNFYLNTSTPLNLQTMDEIIIMLPDCFVELENFMFHNSTNSLYQIQSHNDSAGIDGQYIYGGLLDKCRIYDTFEDNILSDLLYNVLTNYNILDIQQTKTKEINVISSEAFTLCFCEDDQKYDCIGNRSVSVLRGEKFNVSILALSQGSTITAPVLLAKVSETARLELKQNSVNLTTKCNTVSYNMYSMTNYEVLTLYPDKTCRDQGKAVALVKVYFKPCPDGFAQSMDKCDCEERLLQYNAKCTINREGMYVITKGSSKFWVNALYTNETDKEGYKGLILYKSCPTDYCKNVNLNISLEEPDEQCDFNHSGLLCGTCATNYSLIFGNSKCRLCPNIYLYTVAPFASAGIALVFFLSVLRLTVATGMMNSIILYANIVQANKNLFLPNAGNNVLTVFIAWMNLDLGFPTCFYHGMNAYEQTWLQFAFPIYIWVLISVIIITSRYSGFITRLIGSNPIAVLATLLLMSYAKILKTITQIYSFVYLDYPNNIKVKVWLKDANMPYLEGHHLLLAVFGSIFIAVFFLPYTVLLLSGYKLYRYSNKLCIHWFMLKMKPLLDSYYAPYQKHTRYWTGFLLFLHCGLYTVFSFNSIGGSKNSLLAITTAYTAVIVIAWLSVKIYKNFYVNVIEATVYLDLIILSAATSNESNSPALVYTLVGFVFTVMIGIIFFQFHLLYIAKSTIWLKITSKYKSFKVLIKKQDNMAENERSPLNPSVTSNDTTTDIKFRESLMEDYVTSRNKN